MVSVVLLRCLSVMVTQHLIKKIKFILLLTSVKSKHQPERWNRQAPERIAEEDFSHETQPTIKNGLTYFLVFQRKFTVNSCIFEPADDHLK